MNLRVSGISNLNASNSVSFGMARFSNEGLKLAEGLTDIYAPLGNPSDFQDAAFFEKKKFLSKTPFEKYATRALKTPDGSTRVAHAIRECGTSKNAFANARFVKQLLSAKKVIESKTPDVQEPIRIAVEEVFQANWNNPELSKNETMELLELARGPIDDRKYVVLSGVINNSDATRPVAPPQRDY